jgi:hypothetical protein
VVNCDVTDEVSRPPPADRTPDGPAGTLTVTVVDGWNAAVGTKIRESPCAVQLPGTLGVIVGFGDLGDMSAENVTTIGSAPSTPVAWLDGEIAVRRTGATALWAVEPDPAWPCWAADDCVTATTTPAVIAIAAAVPRTMNLALGRCESLPVPGG